MTEQEYHKYKTPSNFIKSVARGFNKSFIFLGNCGIGKTYLTKKILIEEGVDFRESSGVITPLALYKFLYENNREDLILVFDDVSSLINNLNSYGIFLGALYGGVVKWESTRENNLPSQFNFVGKIIIIANKITSHIIRSRCLTHEMNFKYEDKINMMEIISKQSHKVLSIEERTRIFNFIKDNTNKDNLNFDLRTQYKAEQFFLYDKENWKENILSLLKKSEMELLIACINKFDTTKEAQEEWCKETGNSRRKFFYLKQQECKLH
jgi:hypothetical protein|tara:strand:+ start:4113 stop:4910 length:798 start_codon:yes stop_codon:yes gene_type:complete